MASRRGACMTLPAGPGSTRVDPPATLVYVAWESPLMTDWPGQCRAAAGRGDPDDTGSAGHGPGPEAGQRAAGRATRWGGWIRWLAVVRDRGRRPAARGRRQTAAGARVLHTSAARTSALP